jgi:hypothetical protein
VQETMLEAQNLLLNYSFKLFFNLHLAKRSHNDHFPPFMQASLSVDIICSQYFKDIFIDVTTKLKILIKYNLYIMNMKYKFFLYKFNYYNSNISYISY